MIHHRNIDLNMPQKNYRRALPASRRKEKIKNRPNAMPPIRDRFAMTIGCRQ
jgi:hypothetical protein